MKVLINVDKPLRRGLRIGINPTTSKWVDIKYERLGDFCYYCGRPGHVDRDCYNINRMPKEETLKERILLDKLKNKKS
ncbi:Retrotransposon Gag-like protein 3 [Bienertia sinuspersici]